MTPSLFNQLAIDEQYEQIRHRGVFLQNRQVGQWTYYLYALDSLFVELCYDRQLMQFASCQAFTDVARLDFYLAAIELQLRW